MAGDRPARPQPSQHRHLGADERELGRAGHRHGTGAAGLLHGARRDETGRPNDGWEHVDSDILGIHDYTAEPDVLRSRYRDDRAVYKTVTGPGPQHRRPVLNAMQLARYEDGRAPLMITEFGGVSRQGDASTWGYVEVDSDAEYARLLRGLFDALRDCPAIAGFCYTQLTDTLQEANGLLTADRRPKLPIETLREIVTGSSAEAMGITSTVG
jgi:hypothetical protein